ncbi:MAG: hypothetical protein NVS1B13_26330 [Flavisolibacter sp.]
MVKISELKEGDIVNVLFSGQEKQGTVIETSREDNMVLIDNGSQEFWYAPEDISPIPLTGERLVQLLGFEKETSAEGTKYKKGPFRILVHDPGNYTQLDIWYREDHRHFNHPLYIHELQNHHLDMTKVALDKVQTH